MGKNTFLFFTRILYIIFAIGTVISLFIVYKDVDSGIAFKFVMGYLVLALFLLLYIPFMAILKSRKLKWAELKKRLFMFITLFILFGVANYAFDYVFRPSNIDLFRTIPIALGLAFGITFTDIILLKNKDN